MLMSPIQKSGSKPRILIVTPEITYVPRSMGNMAGHLRAKAGGLADVTASLVASLCDLGADVHVALPHYRRMFNIEVGRLINDELRIYKQILPHSRIHLAQDRVFYYRSEVYGNYQYDSHKIAMAFQREVINNIIPLVGPDLVHCNDWMTGLVPAMARRMSVPSLFTIHNIHTQELSLGHIEESGIDAAEFWPNLYYTRFPASYEETRDNNSVDLLTSGIFASHFVNTVSPTFLKEICEGRHEFVPYHVRQELTSKFNAGCAFGITNAPDPSFNPATDGYLDAVYTHETHAEGKAENKVRLQERLGLAQDPNAPLFFWPSRLDPLQKGPQLLTDILYRVVSKYWRQKLQLVVIASGPYQQPFRHIAGFHDIYDRVAVCDFDEEFSHKGYAASDFLLMPSSFEPCGLPQMIGSIYGSLPIVHDTGGLHDTVQPIEIESDSGNGFVFKVFDSGGLSWCIDQAMAFHALPADVRNRQVSRIMRESAQRFNHNVTAREYFNLYEKMLRRPLVEAF